MTETRAAVMPERLRDQVYRLIRDDLRAGVFEPGQRVVEGDLAGRYRVSRTPVREALMKLAQDGLVIESQDRRYSVRADTEETCAELHQVRRLLDPLLARQAALAGSIPQKRALARLQAKQRAAHVAGPMEDFVSANARFREQVRMMCGNSFLAKCCAFADDGSQWERRNAFARPDYRALEVEFDERLTAAIVNSEADRAEAIMRDYVDRIRAAH